MLLQLARASRRLTGWESLINCSQHTLFRPLVIYMPPFSRTADETLALAPDFLRAYPTAIINYRWPECLPSENLDPLDEAFSGGEQQQPDLAPIGWPTPVHDTLFGYDWIIKNLAPPQKQRRGIYVYGSYLGASLGAALGLTESHPQQRMAVRGFATYNGIYNWTTFLPGHPVNKAKEGGKLSDLLPLVADEGSTFHYMRQQIPALFKTPSNLFDPFASPILFFHTAGMLVPSNFSPSNLPSALTQAIDALSGDGLLCPTTAAIEMMPKTPRKGYLTFPPRKSTLGIPKSLFLHGAAPPEPVRARRRGKSDRKPRLGANSFATQAEELAALMRRSINKLELKEHLENGQEIDDPDREPERRVRVVDTGTADATFELCKSGEDLIDAWLQERMGDA